METAVQAYALLILEETENSWRQDFRVGSGLTARTRGEDAQGRGSLRCNGLDVVGADCRPRPGSDPLTTAGS
ncbi:hypothetical protein RHOER0001_1612 [Rhodococcus erythropolis SK121]|nr:hypothetical protein RHOER0001_1612 [Rhodococcus erythropolis SK121]